MGKYNSRQMGPFCCKARLQDSFHQETDPFPISSVLQTVNKSCFRRRGPKAPPKEGSGEYQPGRSRFLLKDFSSPKEKWKVATSNRSVQTEQVSEYSVIQYGNGEQGQEFHIPQRLGNFTRPNGCLSSCSHSCDISEIPPILSEGPGLSVQGTSIWPGHKSVRFYSADGSHSYTSQNSSNYSVSISGRLAGQKSVLSSIKQGQGIHSQIDYFARLNNQSREIGSNSIPEFHIYRDGIYNSNQCCPSSSGQSSGYSRPDFLDSETNCCHSQNVSVFTGEAECFCPIHRIRQTAPSPSSDGTFRSVETSCSSTGTQNSSHSTDKTSSGLVVRQGQIYSGSYTSTTSSSAHSLYRRELFGLGCSSGAGGTHVSWSLASKPISFTHQHSRNEGYSSSSQRVPAHSVQFLCNDSDRQFLGRCLSPEGGRHPFSNLVHGSLGNSSLVSRTWNISQGPTHSRENQYFGRPPVEVRQANINRMVPESANMQFDFSDDGTSQHRSVCNSAKQQASSVCVSSTGQQCFSNRCHVHELGWDSCICISPISHHSSDPHQDSHVQMQDSVDRSALASQNLVSGVASSIDSCSNISTGDSRFFNSKNRNRKLCASPPKSPISFSSRLDFVKRSVTNKNFSRDIAEHISKARRSSTRKVYEAKWGVFTSWCRTRKITPSKASVSDIADFLLYLFEVKKCQASTIKCYRSMISNTLKFHSGFDIGSDPILSELMKAFELQRPVQRSLLPRWDLGCVLFSLCKEPYEPLQKSSLLNLTRKTVFLLALATASRVSEIHAFSVDSEHLRFNKLDGSVSIRTQPGFLAKNQLPSRCPDDILVPNLAKTLKRKDFNRLLCPVRALKYYVKQTKLIRNGRNRLFLPVKGNHDINKGSISGWISSVIRLAYKDLSKKKLALLNIRAHEVRALATSWSYFSKTPLDEVIRAARWSSHLVFAKFYLRDLQKQSQNLRLLGSLVTAQNVVGGAVGSSSHSC